MIEIWDCFHLWADNKTHRFLLLFFRTFVGEIVITDIILNFALLRKKETLLYPMDRIGIIPKNCARILNKKIYFKIVCSCSPEVVGDSVCIWKGCVLSWPGLCI